MYSFFFFFLLTDAKWDKDFIYFFVFCEME